MKHRLARLERLASREGAALCVCMQSYNVIVPGVTPPLPPGRACPKCGAPPRVITITIPPPRGTDSEAFRLRTDV